MTCVWEPDPACLGDKWADLTPEEQDRALRLATSSLQMLTYNRVGSCATTIRPCATERPCGCAWEPYNRGGQWFNGCPCQTRCQAVSEIALPGPVGAIYAIVIDGVAVAYEEGWADAGWDHLVWDRQYDFRDFRIDEGNILVWQGAGDSPFPETQDLNKPLSEAGTWGIVYSQSYPVGPDAQIAVARLAMEFAEACKPKGKCSLPRGVTNVVRNGVSFTVEAGLFPGGLTGDTLVDAFILKWAPAGSPLRSATVFDPRGKGYRRTTLGSSLPGGL